MTIPNRKLTDYLPPELRDVREFRAVFDREDAQLDAFSANALDAFRDNFLTVIDDDPLTATVAGVAHWERLLGITPKSDQSLSDRKLVILQKLWFKQPYTMQTLITQMEALVGGGKYKIDASRLSEYILKISVDLGEKSKFNAVLAMLDWILPANLALNLTLLYNTHEQFTNAGFHHGGTDTIYDKQMIDHVQSELREGVIDFE